MKYINNSACFFTNKIIIKFRFYLLCYNEIIYMKANQAKQAINKLKNSDKAQIYARFFKTGKGEYGEGDKFLGSNIV